MKTHTTNYFDTFIEVADDTKADCGTQPPAKDKKTIAEMQVELISENPYKYTSLWKCLSVMPTVSKSFWMNYPSKSRAN